MKKLAKIAAGHGITLGMEVLNRFEGYLLNTSEEAVAYVCDVDEPNVKVMLDTFHMNIEEDNIGNAIREAGALLRHLHVGEGNRKIPGQGSLPWADIGKALRDIGFNGGVVMEPFVLQGGQIGKDIKVFRDLSGGADEAKMDANIKAGLAVLKSNFLQ